MRIAAIIIAVVVLAALVAYMFVLIRRIADLLHMNTKNHIVKGVIAAIEVVIVIIVAQFGSSGFVALMHVIVVSLVLELFNLVLKRFGIWTKIFKSCILPVVIMAVFFGYGYYNIRNVVREEYTIYTDKSIRQEGYKIAMISDLHFGITLSKDELQEYCDKISAENPDMLVLCGDIVDERTTKEEMLDAAKTLGSVKTNYGIYYIYGNHDKCTYTNTPAFSVDELSAALTDTNIKVLKDETTVINDDFTIIGRDDVGFDRDGSRVSGEELLKQVDTNDFLLMLDHQPSELKQNDSLGYDLQLSGHTHNGQIWPTGYFSEWLHMNEMSYGYKKFSNLQVIVSSGMAGWGTPIRTQSQSEYVIINVAKK